MKYAEGEPGTVVRISELGRQDTVFRVRVSFGDDQHHEADVTDPGDAASEAGLSWYFEEHLRYPFLDSDREQAVVNHIRKYGEKLFFEIFKDAAAERYMELRERSFDGCMLEVSGSAAFHALHWETLQDPDLDNPLASLLPITRLVARNHKADDLPDALPTLNILIVVARPFGHEDVGYRTIARPLLDALQKVDLPVTVDIVRAGTWDALYAHLEDTTERHGPGWYQIVHLDMHGLFTEWQTLEIRKALRLWHIPRPIDQFEGRRGFLFFETDVRGVPQPVPAEELAVLLNKHLALVVVLNACQSAMQTASEVGLAQQLAEAGIEAAVGMAYAVTVTAAARAMPVLYRQLAAGAPPAAALQAVRSSLYSDRERHVYFDHLVNLHDWMLPVMFGHRPVQVRLREMTTAEKQHFTRRRQMVGDEPAPTYGFLGRDLDVQEIERQLLTGQNNNELLLQGMAGAGKSTLLAHLAWWWQRTGLVEQVFRFSYEDRAWTSEQIIDSIHAALPGTSENDQSDRPASHSAQMNQVTGLLRSTRHLLILDSIESITVPPSATPNSLKPGERERVKALLSRLRGGRTLVLLGSREPANWLTAEDSGPGIYPLSGLDPQASSILVERILQKHNAAHYLQDDAERSALQDLVALLNGYPLPLTAVLPVLESANPSAVLADLAAGGGSADPSSLIQHSIQYSYEKLPPETQNSLLLLAPFTSVISTGPVLDRYQELVKENNEISKLGAIDLNSAINHAISAGLASPHPEMARMVQLQPVLPYFLRKKISEHASIQAAAEQAHYLLYCLLGAELEKMLNSPAEPERRAAGQSAARAEHTNLAAAVSYGLRTSQPIARMLSPLDLYLTQTQQHDARRHIVEGAIAASPPPTDSDQQRQLSGLYGLSGLIALSQHRLDDALAHYQAELRLLQAAGERLGQASSYNQLGRVAREQRRFADAESNYRMALSIFLEFGEDRRAAMVYHNLGSVAFEQEHLADAEANCQRALELKLRSGDRYSAATSYQLLGAVAMRQRRYKEARTSLHNARLIFEEFGDSYHAAAVYDSLAQIDRAQRQDTRADERQRQALGTYRKLGDRYMTAQAYYQLGVAAQEEGRQSEAEACFRKALELSAESADRHLAAQILVNLGAAVQQQQRNAEAEACYRQALEIYQEAGDRRNMAGPYHNLGAIAQQEGRYTEAGASYDKALAILEEYGGQRDIARVHHQIGTLRQQQGDLTSAEENCLKALSFFREAGDVRSASTTATVLGTVLLKAGRYDEAASTLVYAAATWRQESGQWSPDDIQLLLMACAAAGTDKVISIIKENVSSDLQNEMLIAILAKLESELPERCTALIPTRLTRYRRRAPMRCSPAADKVRSRCPAQARSSAVPPRSHTRTLVVSRELAVGSSPCL